jgi:hypothetical protein
MLNERTKQIYFPLQFFTTTSEDLVPSSGEPVTQRAPDTNQQWQQSPINHSKASPINWTGGKVLIVIKKCENVHDDPTLRTFEILTIHAGRRK